MGFEDFEASPALQESTLERVRNQLEISKTELHESMMDEKDLVISRAVEAMADAVAYLSNAIPVSGEDFMRVRNQLEMSKTELHESMVGENDPRIVRALGAMTDAIAHFDAQEKR